MEKKLFLLAYFIAWATGLLFCVYEVDEWLPAKVNKEAIANLFVAYSGGTRTGGSKKEFFMETNKGYTFEVVEGEYFHLQKGDAILVAYSPIFKDPKSWAGRSFQNGSLIGSGIDGAPRPLYYGSSILAILLAVVAIISQRFEYRVAIAFFLMVWAAIRFWVVQSIL